MPQTEATAMVSKVEAADLLGVTTKTVERLVQRGQLIPYRKGIAPNRVFFSRTQVEQLKVATPAELSSGGPKEKRRRSRRARQGKK